MLFILRRQAAEKVLPDPDNAGENAYSTSESTGL
jgi:hypothetical protein